MTTIQLKLPDSIHRRIIEIANNDGISINQFLTTAAAEKLSAFDTVEYLRKRAKQSSEKAFQQALSEIPDIEPEPYDRL
ncbi:Ribbon-helix-helix-containing [Desulfonema limicola]|uniref:Ribbon-helix-helix-containing n=1 Tax=Desulfonema limicola TaxID=45656 RepID=A0A975GGP6_9BACT|nr:hypothetical protein [Desulfonema limicola]QTA80474.1 Ribbon-helix-helix-containing [Desulfonema limicola]